MLHVVLSYSKMRASRALVSCSSSAGDIVLRREKPGILRDKSVTNE